MNSFSASFLKRLLSWQVALLLIVLLAAVPRFIELDTVPVGADGDVAWYGINALDWLDRGVWPYYIRELYGAEPLSIYSTGLAALFTGISNATARIGTAVAGVLWVALLFPAAWWLLADYPRTVRIRAGLLSALGAALSLHAVFVSRLGLPAPYLPTIITLIIALTAWAWAKGGYGRWALAGAALALTEYTYIAGRVFPLVIVIWFAYTFFNQRERFRQQWRGWMVMAAVSFVVVLPNIVTYVTLPLAFAGRVGAATPYSGALIWQLDTTKYGGPWGLMLAKLENNFRAAGIIWQSGPYTTGLEQPILTPLLFIGFLVSLLLLFRRPRVYGWMGLAIPVALLPDLISSLTPQPHAMRQINVLPFLFLLAGIGLSQSWDWLDRRIRATQWRAALAGVVVALVIIPALPLLYQWFAVSTPQLYSQPDTGWRSLQTDLDISRRITSQPQDTYLIPYTEYERSSLAWGIAGVFRDRRSAIDASGMVQVGDLPDHVTVMLPTDPYRVRWDGHTAQVDDRLWVLLRAGKTLFLPPISTGQAAALTALIAQGQSEPLIDRSGTEIARFTTIAPPQNLFAPRPVVDYPTDAAFGGQLQLAGYNVPSLDVQPGQVFFTTLFWKTLQPASEDYEVFVQLWNDAGEAVSQWQNVPFGGMYRTRIWGINEMVATHQWLQLPPDAPPGRYRLVVGLFRTLAGQRVAVTGANADTTNNVAIIDNLRVPLPPATTRGTPPPSPIEFGDLLRIAGLDATINGVSQPIGGQWTAQPGATITLETHWETIAQPPVDYTAFLHLVPKGATAPAAQADALIKNGYPTGIWRPGDLTDDGLTLTLPPDLPAGEYTLWFGVYYWQTNERLPVSENGAEQPDQHIQLADITVP